MTGVDFFDCPTLTIPNCPFEGVLQCDEMELIFLQEKSFTSQLGIDLVRQSNQDSGLDHVCLLEADGYTFPAQSGQEANERDEIRNFNSKCTDLLGTVGNLLLSKQGTLDE